MRYRNSTEGRFLDRPNRFIAHVAFPGGTEVCHVKNTGRCRELLLPGARVWCERAEAPGRKTEYDLIAVEKGSRLINMDAQAPNRVFAEWVQAGRWRGAPVSLWPEYVWEDSRFDFRLDTPGGPQLVEVKGVTLEKSGRASFPDAPTERGVKHLRGLTRASSRGLSAAVVFIIQMEDVLDFSPADEIHPEFGAALRAAAASGVSVEALRCAVTPDSLSVLGSVPVLL